MLLAAYDALMASRLDVSLLSSASAPAPVPGALAHHSEGEEPEDPDRPMTKAERQNAKKKRRKQRERALKAAAAAAKGEALPKPAQNQQEEGPIPFRLFSPLVAISLITVENYELTSNPRVRPLYRDVQERIRRCAAEAAVDPPSFPSLLSPPAKADEWRADESTPPVFLGYTAEVEHKRTTRQHNPGPRLLSLCRTPPDVIDPGPTVVPLLSGLLPRVRTPE
ncbi:hypothetical protein CspeluHIS016_0107070 [Cutaneotrichosporon spelunceum]|uniref:Uncharacterized protein n=1 Tax=Cutaneotrichosporon spelunceum TaxID=1672016 RepID=A0AAD3TPI3_9TREE|nr:hypothetical protein CspeluHIS016_0107070 [Cutaneotrichosporon spelunceum]